VATCYYDGASYDIDGYERIRLAVYSDERAYYSDDSFEAEADCMRAWIAARPEAIRAMIPE